MNKCDIPRQTNPASYRWEVLVASLLWVLLAIVPSLINASGIYANKQQSEILESRSQQLELRSQRLNEQEVAWNQLDRAQRFFERGDYQECSHAISITPTNSIFVRQRAQHLFEQCYTPFASSVLDQAKEKAKANEFEQAIALAEKIDRGQRRQEADQLINRWSQRLLVLATQEYQPFDQETIATATSMLAAIPERSQFYNSAQKRTSEWNRKRVDSLAGQTVSSALKDSPTEQDNPKTTIILLGSIFLTLCCLGRVLGG